MPDSLSDLFHRGERLSERAPVFEATVAAGAGGLNGTVTVTIDAFDGGQQRWPVDGWNPRGDTYPKRGDRCLVTMSDANRLWLLQWAPGGGGRGPGGRDPQASSASELASFGRIQTGSPQEIIDTIVLPIGTSHGLHTSLGAALTSDNIRAANEARSDYSPGDPSSDHNGPPDVRWAADMAMGTEVPTPQMGACAEQLAQKFDIPWSGAGGPTATRGGFKYQLIYNVGADSVFGNHMNHVHFGVHVV